MARPCFRLLAAAGLAVSVAAQADDARFDRVRAAFAEGNYGHAAKLGEQLVEQGAADAGAWLWLARAYCHRALKANVIVRAMLAGSCRLAYERAVEADGKLLDARFELMQFYAEAPRLIGGGKRKARAQADAIAALDPGYGHLAHGVLRLRLDRDDAAAETAFRAAIDAGGEQRRRAHEALTALLAAQQRWAEVRALWTQALALDVDDARALFMLGRTAALSGEELAAGLEYLDRYLALAAQPRDIGVAPAHWRRGLILERLGRRDEAIAALRTAAALRSPLVPAQAELDRVLGRR